MARVYSTQFYAGGIDGMTTAEYNVTDGYLAVIRDVVGTIDTPTGDGGLFRISAESTIFLEWIAPKNGRWTFSWQGRIVVPATNTILIQNLDGGVFVNVVVSGYLLTTP